MNDVDIVINNVSGEDAIKRKSKYKITNVIVIAVAVFLLTFGFALYMKQNETTTDKTTETLYVQSVQCDYILNTNTMKAHKSDCRYVDKIDDKNREEYHGTDEELQDMGYTPCKCCQAW